MTPDEGAPPPVEAIPVPDIPVPGVVPDTEYDREQDPEWQKRKDLEAARQAEDATAALARILDTPYEVKIGERTYAVTSRPFHFYRQIVNEMASIGLLPSMLQRELDTAGEGATEESILEAIRKKGEDGDRAMVRIAQLLVQPPPEKDADCRPLRDEEYLLPTNVALFHLTHHGFAGMLRTFVARDHLIGGGAVRKTLALLTKQ
jgi:hypothetical protein